MPAWGTPGTPLDTLRLSDFSAEPQKSHGAGSINRIPPCLRLNWPLSRRSTDWKRTFVKGW
jgi:hypothetical protein